jgi:hypothetical protein
MNDAAACLITLVQYSMALSASRLTAGEKFT